MASGGYRKPQNPAPASGPGALSRRTDGGPAKQPIRELPNAEYGGAAEFRELQQGAPLPSAPAAPKPSAPLLSPPAQPPGVPLNAPSQYADQPVTAGADAGAGPGMESLGIPNQMDVDVAAMRSRLPALELLASHPGTSQAVRNYVRRLRGMVGP